jgi:hypothetical protein
MRHETHEKWPFCGIATRKRSPEGALSYFISPFVKPPLLGVLAYTFARIGAVVNLKVEGYYPSGKRFLLRFKEKGGKEKELPVHHKLEELLDEYLKATGLGAEPGSPLFPAALGKTGKLSRRPLVRTDARRHAQTTAQTSWTPGPLFASLIPGDRHHEFSGKRRHFGSCSADRRPR